MKGHGAFATDFKIETGFEKLNNGLKNETSSGERRDAHYVRPLVEFR